MLCNHVHKRFRAAWCYFRFYLQFVDANHQINVTLCHCIISLKGDLEIKKTKLRPANSLALLFWVNQIQRSFRLQIDILEHKLCVKEFRINMIWCKISLAEDEYLGRLVTWGLRFCGMNFLEHLAEDPQQSIIILGAKYLCDEMTTRN